MTNIPLFLLGIAVGSFLNVLALRYKEGHRIFTSDVVKGRSHCPYCAKTLRWFELLPIVSFIMQGGRCRHCGHGLSWQYPIVEVATGLIFVFVPQFAAPAPIWILAMVVLLLMSLIDLRLYIIPDQLNWFLVLLGLGIIAGKGIDSFAIWESHVIGAAFGAAFFGLIIALTRGRGMGLGDFKLAAALGFLFGWPHMLLISMVAFVVGGLFAASILALRFRSLKDRLPFGPFLALASAFVLFFGEAIINRYVGYFQIFQ